MLDLVLCIAARLLLLKADQTSCFLTLFWADVWETQPLPSFPLSLSPSVIIYLTSFLPLRRPDTVGKDSDFLISLPTSLPTSFALLALITLTSLGFKTLTTVKWHQQQTRRDNSLWGDHSPGLNKLVRTPKLLLCFTFIQSIWKNNQWSHVRIFIDTWK